MCNNVRQMSQSRSTGVYFNNNKVCLVHVKVQRSLLQNITKFFGLCQKISLESPSDNHKNGIKDNRLLQTNLQNTSAAVIDDNAIGIIDGNVKPLDSIHKCIQ